MGSQLPSPEERVETLGAKLNLSAEQKEKLLPVVARQQEQLQALASDTSMSRRKKMRELRDVQQETDEKVLAILTSEQKKQYQELRKEQKQKVRERLGRWR
jgi:hypothetical protein